MDEAKLDGTGEDVPGRCILEGTDLEISYNLYSATIWKAAI